MQSLQADPPEQKNMNPTIGDGAREIRETHEKGGVYGNGCTHPMGERVILLKEFISRLFALFAGNPITFLGE
jgi:hypothetical protein